jgi:hypothetical protein
MKNTEMTNRLQTHLSNMIALEMAIDGSLGNLLPEVTSHAEVSALLTKFQSMAEGQKHALESRLQYIGEKTAFSPQAPATELANGLIHDEKYPVSGALQAAYTFFSQAIAGYAVLHPLATRFADSLVIAEEGTSYHLCRKHGQNYIEAVQTVSQLIPDVILWELDKEHLECQCTCPSCGVGVCVCALAGRDFLREAWREVGPIASDEGVFVQTPRQNSAASKTGLHLGDVIIAAEDQEIESYGDLQNIIRNSEADATLKLKVHRYSDGTENVDLVRS